MNITILILFICTMCFLSGSHKQIGGGKYHPFLDRNFTTVAKGIAILFIILCHCSGSWPYGRLLTPLGGIGVSIFLIISGYGLNESYKKHGLTNFWRKRIVRVYIPYFFAAIILGVFHSWGVKDWFLNLLVIKCFYWFICYILVCYIVFWICSKSFTNSRVVIISAIAIITFPFLPNLQAEQCLGFVTGLLMSTYKEPLLKFVANKKHVAYVVIFSFLIGLAFLTIKQLPVIRDEAGTIEMNLIQTMIKWPISIGVLLGLMFTKPILRNPFIFLAGTISYELYIVHFPFYPLINGELWPALTLIVLSFIIAYGFYRLNNIVCKRLIL